jgi:hypothetical protein
VAEWSAETLELLSVTQLDIGTDENFADGGKIKLASIGKRFIVVYQPDIKQIRVFDVISRQFIRTIV